MFTLGVRMQAEFPLEGCDELVAGKCVHLQTARQIRQEQRAAISVK